jgi:hypothetical protein
MNDTSVVSWIQFGFADLLKGPCLGNAVPENQVNILAKLWGCGKTTPWLDIIENWNLV